MRWASGMAYPLINIFDANAALNEQAPAPYRGLDRFEARKRIVADLGNAWPRRKN